MEEYFIQNRDERIFLGTTKLLDKYLSLGHTIYMIKDDVVSIVATPEKGWLIDKPIIPVPIKFA